MRPYRDPSIDGDRDSLLTQRVHGVLARMQAGQPGQPTA
jgi:hypothetical protein